jgi:hypothetical protein
MDTEKKEERKMAKEGGVVFEQRQKEHWWTFWTLVFGTVGFQMSGVQRHHRSNEPLEMHPSYPRHKNNLSMQLSPSLSDVVVEPWLGFMTVGWITGSWKLRTFLSNTSV